MLGGSQVFLETHWVWVSGALLIPDPGSFIYFLKNYYYIFFTTDPWRVFKIQKRKKNCWVSKVLVLKPFIAAGFQRWFFNNEYQKFSYFKNCNLLKKKIE